MQKSDKINVLIIGKGGREHALLWAISKSPLLHKLYVTHEIYNINNIATVVNINCSHFLNLTLFCKQNTIDLVIIGSEKYLADGVSDALIAEGISVFGPSKIATQLESSKSFMKDLCKVNNIPTAKYGYFSDIQTAKTFLRNNNLPIVIKADGLAGGKGVFICHTVDEADSIVEEMLKGKFGLSSSTIVIEEFLTGDEVSFFALFDGHNVIPCGASRDYKAITYQEKTYNTGGMGSYSPPQNFTPELEKMVMRKIIYPTASALNGLNIQFHGVLFAGLMITKEGPKLLEYNVRFGDPEIQSLVVRLKTDLLLLMWKTAQGSLHDQSIEWNGKCSVCVVMASKGYPIDYKTGSEIKGLEKLSKLDGINVFHAGTKSEGGKIIADSGRVINVVACANTVAEAREKAYAAIKLIDWPEGVYIQEIGCN